VQIAKNFDLEHPISDRDPLLGIARQSGHQIETLISLYALDQAYPTRLQPELISQYEQISHHWHQWLKLAERSKLRQEPATKKTAEAILLKKRKAVAIEHSSGQHLPSATVQKRQRLVQTQESHLDSACIPIEVLNAGKIITDYLQSTQI
jgi:hypothetical protein